MLPVSVALLGLWLSSTRSKSRQRCVPSRGSGDGSASALSQAVGWTQFLAVAGLRPCSVQLSAGGLSLLGEATHIPPCAFHVAPAAVGVEPLSGFESL